MSLERALRRMDEHEDMDEDGAPGLHAIEGGYRRLRMGGELISARLSVADTMWLRMKGLLGKAGLERDEALWITPCKSIHMFFMRFPIDAVFLDANLQVVRVYDDLRPWSMARGGKFADTVLELPAGTAAFYNLRAGDRLAIEPPA